MTKKDSGAPPLVSFTMSGPHLLSMLGRLGAAHKTSEHGRILIVTEQHADDYSSDELSIVCAGHPASVVARTTTGEGKSLLVHAAGKFVVNFDDLKHLVGAMPKDVLDIAVDQMFKMRIDPAGMATKPKARRFVSQVLDPDNYPAVARLPAELPTRSLPTSVLCPMLERVRFAMPDADDRPALLGVMLRFAPTQIMASATNGHVFASVAKPAALGQPGDMFLPKAMVEIVQSIGAQADSITLAEDSMRCYMETEYTSASCLRPIAGFPALEHQFEAMSFPSSCTVDALQLSESAHALQTLARLSLLKSDKKETKGADTAIGIRVRLKGAVLTLTAGVQATKSSELAGVAAGAEETLEVGNPDDKELSFFINAALIAVTAKNAGGVITLSHNEDIDPVMVKSTEGFTALIMPARE